MLTPEEERFVQYWQEQRLHKKQFLRKISIGLPVVSLLAVVFFINLLSGWYAKASQELHKHGSLVVVILVAMIGIVVFVVIFSARLKWEQNEADYQTLLRKNESASDAKAPN